MPIKRLWQHEAVWFGLVLLLKLWFVRFVLFNSGNLFLVVGLEASSIFALLFLIELFFTNRPWKRILYLVLDALLSTVFLAMVLYARQFARLVTYSAIYQIGLVDDIGGSISALFRPWYLLLYSDIVVFLVVWLVRKTLFHRYFMPRRWSSSLFVLMSGISAFNLIVHAGDVDDATDLAEHAGILTAEAYETFSQVTVSKVEAAVPQHEINSLKRISFSGTRQGFGIAKGDNLIIIQMESIQNFLIGLRVNGQEVMPNLDRLAKENVYFSHFNTQIGQGNTSDAEFITNTSLYPLAYGAMSTFYPSQNYPSLAKLLKARGYTAVAFHTNSETFWNRDKMYPALGFDVFYDRKFFGDQDIIGMGPSDQVLLQKSLSVLELLSNKKKPFYAEYITLSSHNPFVIPKNDQTLPLPKDLQNTMVGNYLESAHYLDTQIGKFVSKLQKDGLWDHTVVVMYGDHFAFVPEAVTKQTEAQLSKLVGHPYDDVDMMNIPMIMHVPGMKHEVIDLEGGQSDTLPTLANLFGISLQQIHFGEDLLNASHNVIGFRYYLPDGSYEDDEVLYNSTTKTVIDWHTHKSRPATPTEIARGNSIMRLENLSVEYIRSLSKSH